MGQDFLDIQQDQLKDKLPMGAKQWTHILESDSRQKDNLSIRQSDKQNNHAEREREIERENLPGR